MFKNLLNGKVYIGESGNIKRRYRDHIKTAMSFSKENKYVGSIYVRCFKK
jgi:predicted GIY-YIG superfamily endonuclease